MDDPRLPADDVRRALAGLERLNRVSRAWAAILPWLRLGIEESAAPVSVLDVATGSGDVMAALAAKTRKLGKNTQWRACDINPLMLHTARSTMSKRGFACDCFEHNIVRQDLPQCNSIVMCSLFLHHLSWDDARCVLARMARAAQHTLIVSDLVRDAASYAMVAGASKLLTSSKVVHTDALRSVRAAWTQEQMQTLANETGLQGATIRRVFPARMLLVWRRTGHSGVLAGGRS